MKVVVNPKYERLDAFIRAIPSRMQPDGDILHNGRNRVEKVAAPDGTMLIIKRFKVPSQLQRLFYTYGMTKARHAYEYALRLQTMDVGTADPVAYIEIKRGRLFHTGYYIYAHVPYPLLDGLESYEESERRQIIRDFAAFTASLHQKRIMHRDYNPRNIFFYKGNGHYRFILIDINRMRFGRLSFRRRIKELGRLNFPLPLAIAIAEQYAIASGRNPNKVCTGLMLERTFNLYWRMKRMLYPLKRLLGLSNQPAE